MTNSSDFFYNVVLGLENENGTMKTGWFGEMKWQLVASLFGAWTLVCICLIKGVNSVGKAVYVTGRKKITIAITLLVNISKNRTSLS